ncbi:MAG: Gfo/Idh/MocA family oxidoreductase [Bifidobacteriaceae bacterium]|jgi:predicted dehydrogenase|nr:Gfo/Idh/MocA family oxidoreductase [Bifidobacteriaceae bacterium]
MKDSKIRIGLLGAGKWGQAHGRVYQEHPLAELVWVCDLNRSRAKALAEELGVEQWGNDYEEMVRTGGIDAVAIATPDFAHADPAVIAAKHGKHLLIEKPLATTREDVFRMMDAITDSGVRAMVDLHNRFSPPFNVAKQAVDAGEIGSIQSAYFRLNDAIWVPLDMLSWAGGSSIVWFLGSHSLDTLCWLVGAPLERVYAVSRSGVLRAQGVDSVDQYLTTLEFSDGTIAQMENGWISPNSMPCVNDIKFSLLGDRGLLNIDASSHTMVQKFVDGRFEVPDTIVSHSIFGTPKGFVFESIRSFVDALASGEEFHVPLADAARVSLGVLAILESARTRQPEDVEWVDF